ncbi:protein MKS1-like [Phragmites australis]|uniref:protein MKS1-like n=1 Tax=Phragmites australis TaxID=29695 RepID=UPI002D77ADC3|nr:protein MKS1-like [Phragmites australis]
MHSPSLLFIDPSLPYVQVSIISSPSIASHLHPPTGQLPMSPTSPRQPGAGAGAGGTRHAAFKVHRDSHNINKASPSSTNSSVSSSSNGAATNNSHRPAPAPRQKQPQPQPVIIYTHSPKVIRTNPRDFMSIVQKLTGLDSPGPARGAPQLARNGGSAVTAAQDESSSSSSESCANAHAHAHAGPPPPYGDPQLMPPLDAHFMAPDIPLFAPGASELQLCAPRGLYGQFPPVDAAALAPMVSANMSNDAGNGGAVFPPSMVEAMRSFPDY